MEKLKKNIIHQIADIEIGRVFTYKDLIFPPEKFGSVIHILFKNCCSGELVRIGRGAFYKPKESSLGLGLLPLDEDELLKYLSNKLNGYVTGLFAYNSMGLTEQIPSILTLATKKYIRPFIFQSLKIETVRSYIEITDDRQIVKYLRILDAIKDIKKIPARTQQEVYEDIKSRYFETYSSEIQYKLVSLAKKYPPRVRKILSDILRDIGSNEMSTELLSTIYPTTRFELNYIPAYKNESAS